MGSPWGLEAGEWDNQIAFYKKATPDVAYIKTLEKLNAPKKVIN